MVAREMMKLLEDMDIDSRKLNVNKEDCETVTEDVGQIKLIEKLVMSW